MSSRWSAPLYERPGRHGPLRRPADRGSVRVRCGDLDLPNRLVIVDENLSEANGDLSFDTPKSHQKRVLSLPPSLIKRVSAHLDTLPDGDDALLFTNRYGRPLRYNQWRKAYFDPAVKAAGLPTSPLTICGPHTERGSRTSTA